MIILNSATLEPCKQEYADGTLLLTAEIDYFFGSGETLDMVIDTYIINPVDGAELLVGNSHIVNSTPVTKDRTEITVAITADQNIDVLRNIINEFGNRTYTLVIKPTLPNSTWDGTKIISTAEVQLIGVDTSISVTEVTSSADNSETTIKVDAKYWNNECMSLNATLSTDQDVHTLSMSYDSNSRYGMVLQPSLFLLVIAIRTLLSRSREHIPLGVIHYHARHGNILKILNKQLKDHV